MFRKKTKIVATLGPATNTSAIIGRMIKSGMTVARLNFSHGTYPDHEKLYQATRKAASQLKQPIAVLQDLTGPKLRLGDLVNGEVELEPGRQLKLVTKKVLGDEKQIQVNYQRLPQEVSQGGKILLNDGRQELEIVSVSADSLTVKVIRGGLIKSRRGMNVPGANLSVSSLTPKDYRDLEFGLKLGVDYVAVSFVRKAKDIIDLKKRLAKTHPQVKIIAKIETAEAIEALDEIIEASDGIMIARGDLAIEIPAEDVPVIQKQIIIKCNELGKPVITATQMLESMTRQALPTRAEVNDIANAIFDGTDAVMLSEETAVGEYPIQALEMMQKVAIKTEQSLIYEQELIGSHLSQKGVAESFGWAALSMAHDLEAAAVVALSKSGYTARMVSRYRPHRPVLVLTSEEIVYRQLALSFGCYPVLIKPIKSNKEMMTQVRALVKKHNLAVPGQIVLIVAGMPFDVSGTTNMLLAEVI